MAASREDGGITRSIESGYDRAETQGEKTKKLVGKDQAKEYKVQGDIIKTQLSVPDDSTDTMHLILRHYIFSLLLLDRRQRKPSISDLPQTLEYLAVWKGKSAAMPEEARRERKPSTSERACLEVNDERRLKKAFKAEGNAKRQGQEDLGEADVVASMAARVENVAMRKRRSERDQSGR
ncbi:hypothetical protein C8J56DRAFT_885825 [Mycena floridula]|nr:hypothetical protein C8J56DRAFT_885825 [Mycena floridula]